MKLKMKMKKQMFLFIIIIFLSSFVFFSQQQSVIASTLFLQSCRKKVAFKKFVGQKLIVDENDVLFTTEVNNSEDCMGMCRKTKKCWAVNVIQQNKDKPYLCQYIRFNRISTPSFKGVSEDTKAILFELDSCVDQLRLKAARHCGDIKDLGFTESGVYSIETELGTEVNVICDMDDADGPWTVFQRRLEEGTEDFYRDWDDYKNGFGSFDGEFWLGNEYLHQLTQGKPDQKNHMKLSYTWIGVPYHGFYQTFSVGNETVNYKLRISTEQASQGGYAHHLKSHNGAFFCTRDHDNDQIDGINKAEQLKTGWWINGDSLLMHLNGQHANGQPIPIQGGIYVSNLVGARVSCTEAEMKFKIVS